MIFQQGIQKQTKNTVYAGFMPAGRPTTKKAPPFGQRLAALRKERGWTQPQLAEQLGVTVKTITYYERFAENPTAKTIDRIADVFGVQPSQLIGSSSGTKKRKSGPQSRLQLLFNQLAVLPRNKQQRITGVIEALLAQETH